MNKIRDGLSMVLLVSGLAYGVDQKSPDLSLENLKLKVQKHFTEQPLEKGITVVGAGLGLVALALSIRLRSLQREAMSRKIANLEHEVRILNGTVANYPDWGLYRRVNGLERRYEGLTYDLDKVERGLGARIEGLSRHVWDLSDQKGAAAHQLLGQRVTKLEQCLAPVVVKPVANSMVKVDSKPVNSEQVNFFEVPKTGC